MMRNMKIAGVGMYLPEKILTNSDLEKMVDTTDEWITTRTGIKERHIARPDEFAGDMALLAAKDALQDAKMEPEELDLILCSTISGEFVTPSVSCLVHRGLNAGSAAAIDLNTACSGFVTALIMAQQFIQTGAYRNILVVGTDTMSKYTDWTDRASCVLFGDGAGAAVVTAQDDPNGFFAFDMGADGIGGKNLTIPNMKWDEADLNRRGGQEKRTFWMDGSEVFKFAVRVMTASMNRTLERAGKTVEDIDVLIPHQANIRIIDGSVKRLKIDINKVYVNIHRTGNTSSACVPMALCEAVRSGMLKRGDTLGLVGFGGGLTWSSLLMKY